MWHNTAVTFTNKSSSLKIAGIGMRSKSIKMMATAAATAAWTTTSNQLYFTYRLGKSIYVPLTCRCNSRTLPQLRGDSFTLPVSVVEALRRVRDIEMAGTSTIQEEENLWQRYKNDDESIINNKHIIVPQKLPPPPPLEAVASLPALLKLPRYNQREPTIDDLYEEIQQQLIPQQQQQQQQSRDEERTPTTTIEIINSIVLSGEGEPTLRFDDMIELVRRIKSSFTETKMSPVHIRLTTNGLVQREITATNNNNNSNNTNICSAARRLKDSGISHISISLMTWDAKQYNDLVRPVLPLTTTTTTTNNLDNDDTTTTNNHTTSKAFDIMCDFIRDAVQVDGLEVETTAVERSDVDKVKTEIFSKSLGVSKPIRWRPYFP
mmetsp:Transcript_55266/g.63779  ORF Transcript_55266/g.63779 Transcript_55266/m.63779 type:complete len:378 (+) Transcript_55266:158-1291(+)